MPKECPPQIEALLKNWNRSANIFRGSFGLLTVLSLVCTVLVGGSSASSAASAGSTVSTGQIGFLQDWQIAVLSITAAISVGIMSALDLRGNADRTRRAWRKLNGAVLRYENEDNYTIEQLNAVYEQAEPIMDGK